MEVRQEKADYGFWESPIDATVIASKSISFTDLHVDNDIIYWGESRPNEKGRTVIVSYHPDNTYRDETSEEYSVGTMVHGYGGGAFLVQDKQIYFANAKDGIVYHKDLRTSLITPITLPFEGRYADFSVDPRHEYLYCIRKNDALKKQFPPTELVRIHIQSKETEVLFSGYDFYSSPSISPDGKKIVWLQWNHPNMPWDENELVIAELNSKNEILNTKIIENKIKGAFYQPTWSPDNKLFVAFDGNKYWNLYKLENSSLTCILQKSADFGRPMWISGTRTFAFINSEEIFVTFCENGIWKSGKIYLKNNGFIEVNNKLTTIYNLAAQKNTIVLFAGNAKLALAVLKTSYNEIFRIQTLRNSIGDSFAEEFISEPVAIEYPTRDLKTAFAFYYPPKNPQYYSSITQIPPPLIIKIHGGPTANADCLFNPKIQYYTSRGFAYLEVNYRGSSGYGRDYREALKGAWGIQEVADCIDAADFLVKKNLASKNKLILAGSSSGGFTVLSTLVASNIFTCASCTYGIADLVAMTEHIHKFEAYYDQALIGGSILENKDLYLQRSPLTFAHKIVTPIIFFHGDNDPVVHVSQTEKMAAALNTAQVYNEVYIFRGEGHGFKKAESIIQSLKKELEFFQHFLQ